MRRVVAFLAALCVVAAGVNAVPAPPSLGAPAAPGLVGSVNKVPPSAADPGKPTIAAAPKVTVPPEGSSGRALYDKVMAAQREATQRGIDRHTKRKTEPPQQLTTAAAVPAADLAKMARTRKMAPADACDPLPGEQWYAKYTPGTVESSPTNNASGTIDVTLTNTGTATWPAGITYLGYHLYDGTGKAVPGDYPKTQLSGAVAAGQSQTVGAVVAPLAPATWRIAWDVWINGLGWFSDNGVCALTVQYVIPNQQPNITLASPPNQGTVVTRTPTLFVTGSDPDNWPGTPLTYQFTVCRDANFSQSCLTRDWSTDTGYTLPPGYVDWNDTFYWKARVSDGKAVTEGQGGNQVTVAVPVPDIWRTVGQGLGLATVDGVVMPYGIWTRTETDAQVAAAGLPLRLQRTYSSGAKNTAGAFGDGWLSWFDAHADWTNGNSVLEITYPDGRQENFGKNSAGELVSTASSGATDKVTQNADGTLTVKDANQEVLSYDTSGHLTQVATSTGDSSLIFARNGSGLVSSITQQPSGRALTVHWNPAVPKDSNGCATGAPPMVSQIDAPAPAAGQAQPKWTYHYTCAQLTQQCDATNACTAYNANPYPANTYDTYFETTPAGVRIDTVHDGGAYDNGTGVTIHTFELPVPGGVRSIWIEQLKADATAAQASDYSAMNPYLGPDVTWYDHDPANGVRPSAKDRPTQYLFDDLYRLRDQAKRPPRVGTEDVPRGLDRIWDYSYLNGRFNDFLDENLNGFSVSFDGWGNYSAKLGNIDPNTQYGSDNGYWDYASGDHTRVTSQYVWPTQQSVSSGFQNFYYDDKSRLTAQVTYPTAAAPNGERTDYTYSKANTDLAVGDRHGGASSGGAEYMPVGLVRTVTTTAGVATYSYDPNGDLSRAVDPLGKRVDYEYDDEGRRTAQTEYSDTYPGGVRTQYVYDANSRMVQQIDPATTNAVTGVRSQLRTCGEYNPDGKPARLIRTTAAACPAPGAAAPTGSRITTYKYGSDGRLGQVIDPAGGVTTYAYIEPGLTAGAPNYDLVDANVEDTVRVVDPRGRTMDYSYERGQLMEQWGYVGAPPIKPGQYRATYQQLLAVTRDHAGRPTQTSDALGHNTKISWTQNDRPAGTTALAVRQADGSTHDVPLSTQTYDGAGRVTSRTTGGLNTVATNFDYEGRPLDVVVDPSGLNRDTKNTYDAAGRLTGTAIIISSQLNRPVAYQHQFTLDANGDVLTDTVPNPLPRGVIGPGEKYVTTYVRDQRGLPIAVTDPRGPATGDNAAYTTNSTYDELGRLTVTTAPPVAVEGQGAQPITKRPQTTYGYDAFGELTDVRDANGNVTHTVYDDGGRPVETDAPAYTPPGSTTPLHPEVKRAYDKAGDLTSVTDADGHTTDYEYDYAGNVITKTGPAVNGVRPVTHYEYDADNELVKTTDPTGRVVRLSYDAMGRVVASSLGDDYGAVTSYGYDDASNLVSVTSPTRAVTTFDYNKAGERIAVHLPGVKNPATTDYNAAGQVIKQTDPAGRVTTTAYDNAGRYGATSHYAADGSFVDTSSVQDDAAGNVVARTDENNVTTTYTVDALNRLAGVTTPVTASTSTTMTAGYDAAGNRVRTTDGNGNATWTTYNTLGLPETVTDPPTTAYPKPADGQWTTSYDANGQPLHQTEPGGVSLTAGYDPLGDLTSVQGTGAGGSDTNDTYGYDLAGRPTSFSTPGGTQSLDYDKYGFLYTSTGPAGNVTYGHNGNGQVTSRADAAGTSTYDYTDDRQTSATDALTGGTRTYGYDPATGEPASTTLASGQTLGFGYDNRGRPADLSVKDPAGSVLADTTYGYDKAGNVTSQQVTGSAAAPTGGTYTYDLANRLGTWTPQDGSAVHTYGYDLAGNRTSDAITGGATTTSSYDARDELVSAGSATYDYTARGTLAGTTVGGTRTTTAFDAVGRMVTDAGQTYSYDALGRLATRNSDHFSYDGPESVPVVQPGQVNALDADGGLLAGKIGATVAAPVTNPHGDVTGWQSTATAGGLAGFTGYDPLGRPANASGLQSGLGFQGQYTDPSTGRVDMGARWYTPGAGAFASRDTVGQGLSGPLSLNDFAYANANPLTFNDPSGHDAIPAGLGLGDLLGGLGEAGGELLAGLLAPEVLAAIGIGAAVAGGVWAAANYGPQALDAIRSALAGATSAAATTTGATAAADVPATVDTPAVRTPAAPTVLASLATFTWQDWVVSTGVSYTGTSRTESFEQLRHYWETVVKYWSNGSTTKDFQDWIQQIGAFSVTVPTLDPSRIWGTITAGQLATSGVATAASASVAGSAGVCGITGTIMSCLAGSHTTPVGGGCAGLTATALSCDMSSPQPGDAVPLREASAAAGLTALPEGPRLPELPSLSTLFNIFNGIYNTETCRGTTQCAMAALSAVPGGSEFDSVGRAGLGADGDRLMYDFGSGGENKIVYRNLRPDEDPAKGLTAKNPDATYTPAGHVLNGSRPNWASQFISTTRSTDVALNSQWSSGRVVAIDLDKFSGEVFDLSTEAGRIANGIRGFTAINRVKSSMEVLLKGYVPPEAITWIMGGP